MVGSDFSAAIGLAVLALAFPTCQGAFPAGATEISQVASSIYFASVLCLGPGLEDPGGSRLRLAVRIQSRAVQEVLPSRVRDPVGTHVSFRGL